MVSNSWPTRNESACAPGRDKSVISVEYPPVSPPLERYDMIDWRDIRSLEELNIFLDAFYLADFATRDGIVAEMKSNLDIFAESDRKQIADGLDNAATSREKPIYKSKRRARPRRR